MYVQCCLNGARAAQEHAALPVTPAAMAHAAREAVQAGAESLHVHPRDDRGAQSLHGADVAATLTAIRAACPGVPVGVTTVATIVPDADQRVALIQSWTVLPDFASVNFSEPGAEAVCRVLLARGVGIEAGLSSVDDTKLLCALGLAESCLRFLLEPEEDVLEPSLATLAAMEHILDAERVTTVRLLHGMNDTAWPLIDTAFQRGYATRIGFEDTLWLPDGSVAASNAQLVALARQTQ